MSSSKNNLSILNSFCFSLSVYRFESLSHQIHSICRGIQSHGRHSIVYLSVAIHIVLERNKLVWIAHERTICYVPLSNSVASANSWNNRDDGIWEYCAKWWASGTIANDGINGTMCGVLISEWTQKQHTNYTYTNRTFLATARCCWFLIFFF